MFLDSDISPEMARSTGIIDESSSVAVKKKRIPIIQVPFYWLFFHQHAYNLSHNLNLAVNSCNVFRS